MGNCNTIEYWNGIWSKWRHDDKKPYIEAMVRNTSNKMYWDEAFKNPKHLEKYSVQRAWWYASGAKSVLDVGCGNGRLLYGMKFAVPDAYLFGVDYSTVAIERMENDYDIDGLAIDVYDLQKVGRTFDMVIVNDVLEHLKDEKLFIQKCLDRLNDGGTFYLALPNNYLGPDDTDEHLRLYTKESATTLMKEFFDDYIIEEINIHLLCIAKKAKTT